MKKKLILSLFMVSLIGNVFAASMTQSSDVDPISVTPSHSLVLGKIEELQSSLTALESETSKEDATTLKKTYRDMINATTSLLSEVTTKNLNISDVESALEKINNTFNPFASGDFYS